MTKNKEKTFLMIAVVVFALILFWVFVPKNDDKVTTKLSNAEKEGENEIVEKELLPEEIGVIMEGENMGQEVDMSETLIVETIEVGEGEQVKVGDTVKIHYKGTLRDGTVFDSSIKRGTPFVTQIGVGKLIKGWDLVIPQMKVGEKAKVTIPPELAYGDRAVGNIPANSTLIFEIEVLAIVEG